MVGVSSNVDTRGVRECATLFQMMQPTILTTELVRVVASHYPLSTRGAHGPAHWFRVRQIGLRLAEETGASPAVVELFALFHDSQRENEHRDPGHGVRGAALATQFREREVFQVSDREMNLLLEACRHHTDGETEAEVTIQTCWDADRLDLGRVGIVPRPDKLCTSTAKQPALIDWAYGNSTRWLEHYLANPENRRRYEQHKRSCPNHRHSHRHHAHSHD